MQRAKAAVPYVARCSRGLTGLVELKMDMGLTCPWLGDGSVVPAPCRRFFSRRCRAESNRFSRVPAGRLTDHPRHRRNRKMGRASLAGRPRPIGFNLSELAPLPPTPPLPL